MIAQVVFDLPLEGPFDYLVPEGLVVGVGSRVKVSFGPRTATGFVVGLLERSTVAKLKPVLSVVGDAPAFSEVDLAFARDFSAYYGCSLGEALATLLRHRQGPGVAKAHKPEISLHRCLPQDYAAAIQKIRQGDVFILAPDAFMVEMLSRHIKDVPAGTRSSVFECDGRYDRVIMVDEDNASYKQEQTPMYETRQVLLKRAEIYGFDVAFVGVSPSVELMAMAGEGRIKVAGGAAAAAPAKIVDMLNYKSVRGLVSPPVRDALEAALKAGRQSILVLNRKGSYRRTRCVDCGEILKCGRCDSPLYFSRSQKKFLCRYCTYTLPGETACPKCGKPSWRSQGIGVEQLQAELKKNFPQARIVSFEREAKPGKKAGPGEFDILIATQALLRFQGTLKARAAAFIDFDAELNRLDPRSAFNAFSLAVHVAGMANEVFIQTRNPGHYVLQSLSRGNMQGFYDEELRLRKEFGFSPFKHWVRISCRARSEKSAQEEASRVYNILEKAAAPAELSVTPPLADGIGRKRDQFRFNVMLQADQVPAAVAFIRSGLGKLKRAGRVIVTLNVDP